MALPTTTTVWLLEVYCWLLGGVMQVIWVELAVRIWQFQLMASPTYTWLFSTRGQKFLPVMVRMVPPLALPVDGDMLVTTISYLN